VKEVPSQHLVEPPDQQLKLKGRLDLFGYAIPQSLYDSLQGRTLHAELGEEVRSLLLVQFSEEAALNAEYSRLVDHLSRSRFEIETRSLLRRQAWWFSVGWEPDDPGSDELMQETGSWLNQRLNPRS
jgi:hypothetical protein